MLKIILLTATLSFAVALFTDSHAQQNKDTNFILREIHMKDAHHAIYSYHAVFIDSRKASPYYRLIENFDFARQKPNAWIPSKSSDYLPDVRVDRHALSELPQNWCPLRLYHRKYYVFNLDFKKLSINDSAVIFMGMEGPYAFKLYGLKKVKAGTFRIKVAAYPEGVRTITIHLIDPRKQVAVFQYSNGKNHQLRYALMVGAKKIRSFPIIVDYSPDVKPQVFMFEEPDFQALLAGQ